MRNTIIVLALLAAGIASAQGVPEGMARVPQAGGPVYQGPVSNTSLQNETQLNFDRSIIVNRQTVFGGQSVTTFIPSAIDLPDNTKAIVHREWIDDGRGVKITRITEEGIKVTVRMFSTFQGDTSAPPPGFSGPVVATPMGR